MAHGNDRLLQNSHLYPCALIVHLRLKNDVAVVPPSYVKMLRPINRSFVFTEQSIRLFNMQYFNGLFIRTRFKQLLISAAVFLLGHRPISLDYSLSNELDHK